MDTDNFEVNAVGMIPSILDGYDTRTEVEIGKLNALLAILQQLKDMNARLDQLSTDLQNIDYTASKQRDSLESIAIRHGGR